MQKTLALQIKNKFSKRGFYSENFLREEVLPYLRGIISRMEGPSVRRVCDAFPQLSPLNVLGMMQKACVEDNRRMIFHIYTSLKKSELIIKKNISIKMSQEDIFFTIFYHDFVKLLPNVNSPILRQILRIEEYGHGIAARRFFLYLGLPHIAQAIRHNSTDFYDDYLKKRVTAPQIVLNIVDRTNEAGMIVDPLEKMRVVIKKIGHLKDFDKYSEIRACHIIKKIVDKDFNLSTFVKSQWKSNEPGKLVVISRFDGKYCSPIGNHIDTSSSVHTAKYLSKMNWSTTIIHNGEFEEFHDHRKTVVLGLSSLTVKRASESIREAELTIVEGWTSAIPIVKKCVSKKSNLVVLFRALSRATLTKKRLRFIKKADEVWVVSDFLRTKLSKIISENISKRMRVSKLQSGVESSLFFVNRNIKRKKGKIVYVGAITRLKGVDLILEAFRKVREELPYVELHLFGDADVYGRQEEVNVSGDGVFTYGSQRQEIIARHLQEAHVFIILTRIEEAFGKSAMEARCCGTPVIVSGNGALPFHVKREGEGQIISNLTVKNVTAALLAQLEEKPCTILPDTERYHDWIITAIDLITLNDLVSRNKLKNRYV